MENSGKLVDIATKAGVAVVGYNATKHWTGGLLGLLGLRLAQSDNLAAGTAGVTVLTTLGLLSAAPLLGIPTGDEFADRPESEKVDCLEKAKQELAFMAPNPVEYIMSPLTYHARVAAYVEAIKQRWVRCMRAIPDDPKDTGGLDRCIEEWTARGYSLEYAKQQCGAD